MTGQTPAEVFGRLISAFGAGDLDALRKEVFAEDVVWHNVDGDFNGVDEVVDNYLGRLQTIGFKVEPLDVLGGDNFAFAFARLSGEHRDKSIDVIDAGAIRVDNGRIAEFWSFANSQDAINEFILEVTRQ